MQMRTKATLSLLAAVLAITFNAHAATPVTSVIATTPSGKTVVLSSANSTLVVKTTLAGAPVKAKLTCLEVDRLNAFISVPPLPHLPATATAVYASAKAGAKSYYVSLVSFGTFGDKISQAVLLLGVTTSPNSVTRCGAGSIHLKAAVGLAVYV